MKAIKFLLFLVVTVLVACTTEPPRPPPQNLHLPLKEAVSYLAKYLLKQVEYDSEQSKTFSFGHSAKKVVLIQQVKENIHNDVPKVYFQKMEKMFLEAGKLYSESLDVRLVSPDFSMDKGDYLLVGDVFYETPNKNDTNAKKLFRIEASVIKLKGNLGLVGKNIEIWLTDEKLDLTPVGGIPSVSTKNDPSAEAQKKVAQGISSMLPAATNSQACDYIAKGNRLLYEGGQDDEAIKAFEEALNHPTGKRVAVYTNLSKLYQRKGNRAKEMEMHKKAIELELKNSGSLEVPIYFETGSTNFIASKKEEYTRWLEQISQLFHENNQCFKVIGHTSCTGTRDYNYQLSEQRAHSVQQLLGGYFSSIISKSSSIGRGFDECKICRKNDNDSTTDRRVEFQLVDCSKIREDETAKRTTVVNQCIE